MWNCKAGLGFQEQSHKSILLSYPQRKAMRTQLWMQVPEMQAEVFCAGAAMVDIEKGVGGANLADKTGRSMWEC